MKNKTCILISMSYTMKVYICLGVWKWGKKKKKKKPMRLIQEVLRKLILKGFRIQLYIKINEGEPKKADSQVR